MFMGINLDRLEKDMKAGDKSLNLGDSISTDKMQNDSNTVKKDYNMSGFMRISVNISEDNHAYLKRYQEKYGVAVATKCTEILNDAIEKMRKESK